MNKTDIELKNVKTMSSPDGYAMSATVYVRGEKAFTLWNDGNGGCNLYTPCLDPKTFKIGDREKGYAIIQECEEFAKTFPLVSEFFPEMEDMKMDLDCLLEEIHAEAEEKKKLAKWCKTDVIFRLPTDKQYTYRSYKNVPYNELVKNSIMKKYPDAIIINETI